MVASWLKHLKHHAFSPERGKKEGKQHLLRNLPTYISLTTAIKREWENKHLAFPTFVLNTGEEDWKWLLDHAVTSVCHRRLKK